jgi:putative nucleotidyltransferase with HDIG domain
MRRQGDKRVGNTPKSAISKQQRVAAIIIIAVTALIVYAFVAISVMPLRYDIKVGKVAPATITASRDIVDKVSTNAALEQARLSVAPIYTIDSGITERTEQSVAGYFDSLRQAAEYMKNAYLDDKAIVTGTSKDRLLEDYDPAAVDWKTFLTPGIKSHVKTLVGDDEMPDEAITVLASMNEQELDNIKARIIEKVSTSLDGGILKDRLSAVKEGIASDMAKLFEDTGTRYLAYTPVEKYLEANLLYDSVATDAAISAAEAAVTPVTYQRNQKIVSQGEVVTEAQYAVLQELGYAGGGQTQDYTLYIGMLLFVALLFAIYAVYMFQFESDIISETRKLVMLMALAVLSVALAVPLSRLDTRIITAFLGTMLASVLVSQRSALTLNLLLAFLIGAVCSWQTGILSITMLRTLMIIIIGGSAAVFALYKPGYRASLIYAGLIAGGLGAGITAINDTIGAAGAASGDIIVDSAFAVGSGMFGGVLAIGTLPIWEAMFRVSTPAKLIELSDPNHPLLKRLTIEAPGTYHHSILTANLAEAGADAVGANSLLCRVGAYYHDVGKLKNPEYFKENQKSENPHDMLDPRESARIITEHLSYGMELARKFKLPRDVQKIMAQHHGDAIVPYFVHKAQEAGINTNDPVFKYKGSKPTSKESAVVMLADSVEAAIRSLDSPDREQVKEMVNKIIRTKYNEGQFDESSLGRKDLNSLAKAFTSVYEGAFHERVKYPGQE